MDTVLFRDSTLKLFFEMRSYYVARLVMNSEAQAIFPPHLLRSWYYKCVHYTLLFTGILNCPT
jgi:hypothetical protein